jgi:hypothetical protein
MATRSPAQRPDIDYEIGLKAGSPTLATLLLDLQAGIGIGESNGNLSRLHHVPDVTLKVNELGVRVGLDLLQDGKQGLTVST